MTGLLNVVTGCQSLLSLLPRQKTALADKIVSG